MSVDVRNENDVTMTIAGWWRYGDWRHVATGCTALVARRRCVIALTGRRHCLPQRSVTFRTTNNRERHIAVPNVTARPSSVPTSLDARCLKRLKAAPSSGNVNRQLTNPLCVVLVHCTKRIRGVCAMRSINILLTYLLTLSNTAVFSANKPTTCSHAAPLKGSLRPKFCPADCSLTAKYFPNRLTSQMSYPQLLQLRQQGSFYDDAGKFDPRCGRNLEIWQCF